MKTIILLALILALVSCRKEIIRSNCGTVMKVSDIGVWVQFPVRNYAFIVHDTAGIKVGQQFCR